MSEYLILLVELHNTFTLLQEARKQLREQETESGKQWIKDIYKELLTINGKLLNDYNDEYLELTETIEAAALSTQYLKIDRFLSSGYFSQITHRLGCLRRQKTQLLKLFTPTTPELTERI